MDKPPLLCRRIPITALLTLSSLHGKTADRFSRPSTILRLELGLDVAGNQIDREQVADVTYLSLSSLPGGEHPVSHGAHGIRPVNRPERLDKLARPRVHEPPHGLDLRARDDGRAVRPGPLDAARDVLDLDRLQAGGLHPVRVLVPACQR